MVPVLPLTVIENVDPIVGVAVDSDTEVILLALAPIVVATLLNPPVVLQRTLAFASPGWWE
jgi:hypothetical protein